jgi:hypothetical protein
MTNDRLEELVKSGTIKSYQYVDVDAYGNYKGTDDYIGGDSRNTQRVVMFFNDGQNVIIDTICSGSLENTDLIIS